MYAACLYPSAVRWQLTSSLAIPHFVPSASPELDQLLSTFREKIFMPAALSQQHRALIYKRSKDAYITAEPGVTVTMSDEEEITLKPMDYFDKPSLRRSLSTFVQILNQHSDHATWSNLVPFLQGLALAKCNVPSWFYPKIARKGCEMGKESLIIRCVENSRDTHVRLSIPGVARELYVSLYKRAMKAGFEGPQLDSAYSRAEKLALLLEDEEHCGGKLRLYSKDKKQFDVDARADPAILNILLGLSASKAAQAEPADEELNKKVVGYIRKVVHAVNHPPQIETVFSSYDISKPPGQAALLEEAIFGRTAVEQALKLKLDQELKEKLEQVAEVLKTRISELEPVVREQAAGRPRRALELYDQA